MLQARAYVMRGLASFNYILNVGHELEASCQVTAGGARGFFGVLSPACTTGASANGGVITRITVSEPVNEMGSEPSMACAQHCIPQPTAQGQPLSWLTGVCILSAADTQRLLIKGLAAATDSGNSNACSATT
jgi:hypothetical protein